MKPFQLYDVGRHDVEVLDLFARIAEQLEELVRFRLMEELRLSEVQTLAPFAPETVNNKNRNVLVM